MFCDWMAAVPPNTAPQSAANYLHRPEKAILAVCKPAEWPLFSAETPRYRPAGKPGGFITGNVRNRGWPCAPSPRGAARLHGKPPRRSGARPDYRGREMPQTRHQAKPEGKPNGGKWQKAKEPQKTTITRRAKPHPSSNRLWRLASLGGYARKTRREAAPL